MAKHRQKTKVFWPKIAFLDFPGRVLSNEARGFPFGENPKIPKIPTQIPKYFGPFLTSWLDLVPARRSGWKKAARGCPRIQIWSHEGPNQSQNHYLFARICQDLTRNVLGPHFSWKFWPGPKYGVSSRRNAQFCVSSRRDDRFWQMCAKFARGLPHRNSL